MSIVMQVSREKEGDPSLTVPVEEAVMWGSDKPVYRREFAVDLVVDKWSQTLAGDTDYYAIWWNEENSQFESYCYASTRGWTYLNGAQIDAPPELREKYRQHRHAEEVARREAARAAHRAKFESECAKLISELEPDQVEDMYELYSWDQYRYEEILPILSKAQSSKFRLSLRYQVKEWLRTPREDRRYATPLSQNQQNSLLASSDPRRYW